MEYYSTNGSQKAVGLREAVMRSYAPDGGVYMPHRIPHIPSAMFKNMDEMSVCDIAYVMCTSLFGTDIAPELINSIVRSTLNFPIPLKDLGDNRYVLELFHGPTESFKDVGARFLAQLCKYYLSLPSATGSKLNVLLASTGDTGNAVTDAFEGIEGVNVFVLYPRIGRLADRVAPPAPHRGNIISVEVNADIDRCRALIRQAFADRDLNRKFALTSANSVNIGRLLPQTFYYFYAYGRLTAALGHQPQSFTVSAPCGNLGNLTAALFSRCMGLPISRFLASGTGGGDRWGEVVNGRLMLSEFHTKALASNIGRVDKLMQLDPALASAINCFTFNREEIAETIRDHFHTQGYLMDRNTAMACRALDSVATTRDVPGVFLATASPRKYARRIFEILGDESPFGRPVPTQAPHDRTHHLPLLPPSLPAITRLIEKYN